MTFCGSRLVSILSSVDSDVGASPGLCRDMGYRLMDPASGCHHRSCDGATADRAL